MSDAATYREASKAKIKRMLADPQTPVDASGFTQPGPELGMIQTGERPVTRARFRAGGSVTGGKTTARVDRKPRASGGMTATEYLNRDVREANESRAGMKNNGGFKYGGAAKDGRARAHKFMGGPMQGGANPYMTAPVAMKPGYASGGKVHADAAEDKKLIKSEMAKHEAGCKCAKCYGGRAGKAEGGGIPSTTHKYDESGKMIPPKEYHIYDNHSGSVVGKATTLKGARRAADRRDTAYGGVKHSAVPVYARGGAIPDGTRPKGGRIARAKGGKAMNVNIIIAPPKPAMGMPPPGMAAPPKGIPAPPPAAMAPQAGAPAPMAPAGGAAPMMGRKDGGRAYPLKDGSGGGKGRLQKIKAYG
jgi:hypothetical protein